MSRYSGHDNYVYPGSDVLRNRFGITDAALLEKTEADIVAARSRELAKTPLRGHFDLAHLQAMHRYLFGDIYEWAGKLRTVDISKGDNTFAHHVYIRAAATPIFEKLANEEYLVGLTRTGFSLRAAYYLGELNALHPFREGNGRTQREFLSHLADKNEYYIAWEDAEAAPLLQASIASFKGDLAPLTAILQNLLREDH